MDSGCVEKPTNATQKTSQLAKALGKHADEGDEATKDIVHEMLGFLWWAPNFRRNSPNALQEGYDRLNAMTTEIERVRATYSSVSKPAADHQFDETETAGIHNKFRDSLSWMNEEIHKDYVALKGNKRNFVKGRFNVYFAKVWGSKVFFMHLVRFGTSCDIAEMLKIFGEFRGSSEYEQIVRANAEKTQEEHELKVKRDQLRRVKNRSSDDERQYLRAKADYEALGRGGAGGVSQASWVDVASSSVAKPAAGKASLGRR